MNQERVNLTLSKSEAIVLHAFLHKFNQVDYPDHIFEDQAEQRVFWNLESDLEMQLPEPFNPNYVYILEQAREDVRDVEYSGTTPEYSDVIVEYSESD